MTEPRCPECAFESPSQERPVRFRARVTVLVVLDILIVGAVAAMLAIPIERSGKRDMLMMVPPVGAIGRLVLYPVQWILALIAVGIATSVRRSDRNIRLVRVLGFGIPIGTVLLTLKFYDQIMRF